MENEIEKLEETEVLGKYVIEVPLITKEVVKERSWLGNGIQQDDINCYSKSVVQVTFYDHDILSRFIKEKLKLHS